MTAYTLSNQKINRKKANRIKKQFLMAAATFVIVITGIVIGGNVLQNRPVQASSVYKNVVNYKSIEVEAGDTLWTIADEYMGNEFTDREDYIDEVKRLNHLSTDTIQAGAYLIVPYTDTVSEL